MPKSYSRKKIPNARFDPVSNKWTMNNTVYDKKDGIKSKFGAKWDKENKEWLFDGDPLKWQCADDIIRDYMNLEYDYMSRSWERECKQERETERKKEEKRVMDIIESWKAVPLKDASPIDISHKEESFNGPAWRRFYHFIMGPAQDVERAISDICGHIIRHDVDKVNGTAIAIYNECFD